MKGTLQILSLIALYVLIIYFMVSGVRYRFAHPEMTQTQCLLNIGDVFKWK